MQHEKKKKGFFPFPTLEAKGISFSSTFNVGNLVRLLQVNPTVSQVPRYNCVLLRVNSQTVHTYPLTTFRLQFRFSCPSAGPHDALPSLFQQAMMSPTDVCLFLQSFEQQYALCPPPSYRHSGRVAGFSTCSSFLFFVRIGWQLPSSSHAN